MLPAAGTPTRRTAPASEGGTADRGQFAYEEAAAGADDQEAVPEPDEAGRKTSLR